MSTPMARMRMARAMSPATTKKMSSIISISVSFLFILVGLQRSIDILVFFMFLSIDKQEFLYYCLIVFKQFYKTINKEEKEV